MLSAATGERIASVTVPWRPADELVAEYAEDGLLPGRLGRPDLVAHQLGYAGILAWQEWPDGSWRTPAWPLARRHIVTAAPLIARHRDIGTLSGPGLNAPLVTTQTAGRIRAGVAHPVIAAGIAAVLVTGVQALALASTPWEALSPQNDTLRLTWHPPNRRLIRASQVTARTRGDGKEAVTSRKRARGRLVRWRGRGIAVRGGLPAVVV